MPIKDKTSEVKKKWRCAGHPETAWYASICLAIQDRHAGDFFGVNKRAFLFNHALPLLS